MEYLIHLCLGLYPNFKSHHHHHVMKILCPFDVVSNSIALIWFPQKVFRCQLSSLINWYFCISDLNFDRAAKVLQGFKEFMNEINILATLQHPQLCKLLGFYAHECSEHRLLVYERLSHGSLDHLLYSRSDGPPIDWGTRMKVALCAAQGLAFLHEEGPFQVIEEN